MDRYIYEVKDVFISPIEIKYLKAIKNALPKGYYVQSQINLGSVIVRNDNAKFHNELFRNVDAGVFDSNHHPIFLIEINDSSHKSKQRSERDLKVKNICEEAGIPLIIFWTVNGVDENYIKKRIDLAFEESKKPIRVKHSYSEKDTTDKSQYIDKINDECKNPFSENEIENKINVFNQTKIKKAKMFATIIIMILVMIFWSLAGWICYKQTLDMDMIYGTSLILIITVIIGLVSIKKQLK